VVKEGVVVQDAVMRLGTTTVFSLDVLTAGMYVTMTTSCMSSTVEWTVPVVIKIFTHWCYNYINLKKKNKKKKIQETERQMRELAVPMWGKEMFTVISSIQN